MKPISEISNLHLHRRTVRYARIEQRAARSLLSHLHEVRRRRVYAELGYASLWEYVVKALGYDEGGASQRIRAMELVTTVPEARKMLASGELSIAKAAAVQSHFRAESVTDREEKTRVLLEVRECSVRYTRELLKRRVEPEALLARGMPIAFEADAELAAMLTRVRELRGGLSLAEIVRLGLRAFLKAHDPLAKPAKIAAPALDPRQDAELARGSARPKGDTSEPSAAGLGTACAQTRPAQSLVTLKVASRYVARDTRRAIATRAGGQCEWVSALSQRRCESRHKLQFDHRLPHALSGAATAENLQLLCAVHNGWRTRGLGG